MESRSHRVCIQTEINQVGIRTGGMVEGEAEQSRSGPAYEGPSVMTLLRRLYFLLQVSQFIGTLEFQNEEDKKIKLYKYISIYNLLYVLDFCRILCFMRVCYGLKSSQATVVGDKKCTGQGFQMHTIELPLDDLCRRDVKEQSFQNLGINQEVTFRLSLPSDSQNDTTESGLPGSGSW